LRNYVEREFNPPIRIKNESVTSIKQARRYADEDCEPKRNESKKEAKDRFLKATLDVAKGSWQNRFAYEVSIGLERIGALVLVGALPTDLLLADCAQIIVKDWFYCSELIKQIRSNSSFNKIVPKCNFDFERRHATWIVCVAALWLSNNWKSKYIDSIIELFGGLEPLKKYEREFRKFESSILSLPLDKEIEKLVS